MKIIIVDDNNEFRSTLRFFIEQKLNHTVIAEATSGKEFLELPPSLISQADIIIMDIVMDLINGIEATKRITWIHKNLKVLAVTMHIEKVFLEQIIEAGFKGCVFKSEVFHTLEKALLEIQAGRLYINEKLLTDR
ncbi:MAG: response regulator transcription factor [Salinivirgaceae bacterium]